MRTATLLVLVVSCCACSRASDSAEAKRLPKPPPSASAAPSTSLHIDVTIDGAPAPPIDAARLASTPPDFTSDEHRAWRASTLLGAAADRAGATITATGEKGVAIAMHPPAGASDPIPVITVNRRGDVIAALVSKDDPFPDYHGRGGRLSRPGDPLPHLAGITKIVVSF
jgi:hypothetical protein